MARSRKTSPEVEGAMESVNEAVRSIDQTPAQVELSVATSEATLPERQSEESIQAMIHEKLSKRSDSPASDPFVPNNQLENEVKEVAKKSGFSLTRGTEIGARLIARAQRFNK